MKKLTLSRVILTISMLCFLYGVYPAVAKEASADSQKKDATYVEAYYFHGNFRCNNCYTIEQYSKEAIEKYFPNQLKNGKLAFTVVNTDQPENEHFIKDYQLYTRSLVVVEFKNGKQVKWTNLTKVWDYIRDRDAFYTYVKTEIEKALKGL